MATPSAGENAESLRTRSSKSLLMTEESGKS
jgi:hypothetical protein